MFFKISEDEANVLESILGQLNFASALAGINPAGDETNMLFSIDDLDCFLRAQVDSLRIVVKAVKEREKKESEANMEMSELDWSCALGVATGQSYLPEWRIEELTTTLKNAASINPDLSLALERWLSVRARQTRADGLDVQSGLTVKELLNVIEGLTDDYNPELDYGAVNVRLMRAAHENPSMQLVLAQWRVKVVKHLDAMKAKADLAKAAPAAEAWTPAEGRKKGKELVKQIQKMVDDKFPEPPASAPKKKPAPRNRDKLGTTIAAAAELTLTPAQAQEISNTLLKKKPAPPKRDKLAPTAAQ